MGKLTAAVKLPKGCTRECCKTLGRPVGRGDKPIKLGDSWFSAKHI